MEKQVSLWPWGAPTAARNVVAETPLFRCKGGAFARERSYDRTLLRFTSQGERTLTDATYEVNNVYAVLLDEHGQLVTRRSHESNRQTLLGPQQLTWAHELYDDQLARAASVVYEIETRVDVRRTLFTGKLGGVDFDSDTRQPWQLTANAAAADRLIQLSLSTFYSRGDFEISMMAATPCSHDGHRTEMEVALLDEAGAFLGSRWMSISINIAGVGYTDNSLRLEKRVARQVAGLEIRGRSEIRTISRIGPILLDDGDKKASSGT